MPRKRPVPQSQLHVRTLDLLKNRPITKTLAIIEADTGLPEDWLASLLSRPEIGADVNRIVILYEYLSGRKLKLA